MPFVLVVLALILLVVLHELGHFLAARAVGIRATKFYVFFPPALLKKKIGEVEYGIGAIPAGGFVKLPGMFEPVPAEVAERVRFDLEPVMPLVRDGDMRLRMDAARRAMAHAQSADELHDPLTEVRTGIASARAEARDDEERALLDRADERIVGLLDDAHPRAYWRAALWRRMTVIFAGPLANLLIAFVVLTAFWWFLSPKLAFDGPLRVAVQPGSPAATAGLNERSRVTAWNGPIDGVDEVDFARRVADARGKFVTVTWHDGAHGPSTTRTIFPAQLDEDGPARLGLGFAGRRVISGRERTTFSSATSVAGREISRVTWGNLTGISKVLFDSETRRQVSSVVGIVQVADEVDQAGQFVHYVALISLVLAVMNILPLLPLDGGHLLFGLLEAVRRRPMPRAVFERYSFVGLALVLMLFVIGLNNDLGGASR
ncbi:MAG: peptidase [Thermoleophilia bacterium]|nr:peptidase [Thermoleophilia bacterium]